MARSGGIPNNLLRPSLLKSNKRFPDSSSGNERIRLSHFNIFVLFSYCQLHCLIVYHNSNPSSRLHIKCQSCPHHLEGSCPLQSFRPRERKGWTKKQVPLSRNSSSLRTNTSKTVTPPATTPATTSRDANRTIILEGTRRGPSGTPTSTMGSPTWPASTPSSAASKSSVSRLRPDT